MFVYLITNLVNGKRYVGQTSKSLEQRWSWHQRSNTGCTALKNAIRKYGAQNFETEMLFDVPTKELADEFEKEYIIKFCTRPPNGYNLTDGGEGVVNPSEELRKLRSLVNIGNKNSVGAVRSIEYREIMSEAQKDRFLNSPVTQETKHKMSEAAKRRVVSQETKDKKSEIAKRLGQRPPVLSSEESAEAGRISGHKRYHVKRGIINPNCRLCKESQC